MSVKISLCHDGMTSNRFCDPVTFGPYTKLADDIASKIKDKNINLSELTDDDLKKHISPQIINSKQIYTPLIFERAFITAWIEEHHSCPFTKQPLEVNNLKPVTFLQPHLEQLAKNEPNDADAIRYKKYWDTVNSFADEKKIKSETFQKFFDANQSDFQHNCYVAHSHRTGTKAMTYGIACLLIIVGLSYFNLIASPLIISLDNLSFTAMVISAITTILGSIWRLWPLHAEGNYPFNSLIGPSTQFTDEAATQTLVNIWSGITQGNMASSKIALNSAVTGKATEVIDTKDYSTFCANLTLGSPMLYSFIPTEKFDHYNANIIITLKSSNISQDTLGTQKYHEARMSLEHIKYLQHNALNDNFPNPTPFYLQPIRWIYCALNAIYSLSLSGNYSDKKVKNQPQSSRHFAPQMQAEHGQTPINRDQSFSVQQGLTRSNN